MEVEARGRARVHAALLAAWQPGRRERKSRSGRWGGAAADARDSAPHWRPIGASARIMQTGPARVLINSWRAFKRASGGGGQVAVI